MSKENAKQLAFLGAAIIGLSVFFYMHRRTGSDLQTTEGLTGDTGLPDSYPDAAGEGIPTYRNSDFNIGGGDTKINYNFPTGGLANYSLPVPPKDKCCGCS